MSTNVPVTSTVLALTVALTVRRSSPETPSTMNSSTLFTLTVVLLKTSLVVATCRVGCDDELIVVRGAQDREVGPGSIHVYRCNALNDTGVKPDSVMVLAAKSTVIAPPEPVKLSVSPAVGLPPSTVKPPMNG